MTNPNKSVWFSNGNKEYVQEQADKENKSFNKKTMQYVVYAVIGLLIFSLILVIAKKR